jgi:DNA (cytosine-5)-methyltransferase 1
MGNTRTTERGGSNEPLTVVDLFAGAGGLTLGLANAGLRVIRAVDHFKAAADTYAKNVGSHIVQGEVGPDSIFPSADVIAGGPPCQGFSTAGRRITNDARNTLVGVFARIVARARPKFVVFENVEGFFTVGEGRFVTDLLDPLIEAGYQVHLRKINAANYGVPQHRKRVIGIGALGFDPDYPEPTHSATGAPGAHLAARHLPFTPSLIEALIGLPSPALRPPGEPLDHCARQISDDDSRRIEGLKPGQTMRDLPESLWHPTYRRRANRRVMDGTPSEKRGGAPAGIRRLLSLDPSKAITSAASAEFVQPTEDRFLTLRECARLQTFPDWFEFLGSRSDRALLIGNAVPPRLAEVIGTHLAQSASFESVPGRGRLLSFVPTLSEGMSPALAAVVEMISKRYLPSQEKREQLALWG